jgi:hypothetical protein
VTERRPPRSRLAALFPFLELLGLSGVAVASPVLQVFADGAEVFVAYRASRLDIVLFALAVVLVVPAALFGLELLAGLLGPTWRRLAHSGAVFLLLGTIALQVLKSETDLGRFAAVPLAGTIALLGAAVVWRWQVPRLFLRFLSVAPIVFLATFLLASPVTVLVLGSRTADAAGVAVGEAAPVVWIVMDELPAATLLGPDDRVDPELFPHLAALAGDGTLYRNSTTVSPHTSDAVPAMLSGRYPEEPDELPVVSEHPENLFTLLGDTYRMNVSEAWADLCPPGMCEDSFRSRRAALPALLGDASNVLEQKADPARPVLPADGRGSTFDYRREQVSDFVDSLDDGEGDDRPRLDFLHVVLPHAHYEYLPDGRRYEAPVPRGRFGSGWVDDDVAAAARQRHVLQMQFTDRLLGDVFDRLRELDRYDESMIIVTADHGASFTKSEPFRGMSEGNLHEIVWTPLVVKAPDEHEGRVDDGLVRSIDLVPTVAEQLEVDVPWRLDGRPIRPGGATDGEVRLFRWEENLLDPDDGDFVTVDAEDGYERMLDEPPARQGDDELAVYRLGDHGDLVGQRVEDLPLRDPVTEDGVVDHVPELASVDLEGDEVPAYLSGESRLRGLDPYYAVAVNGVVGGWAHAYLPQLLPPGLDASYLEQPRLRQWWTMVPPSLLRDGRNRVELLRMGLEEGVGRVLHPVRLRPTG